METQTIDLPAMYGDHHVTEVRRLLLEIPGVEDVYASSAFHAAEVTFDAAKTSLDTIKEKLEEAGYLGDLLVPVEQAVPANERNGNAVFRHTAAHAGVASTVSFVQEAPYTGRPLWPCPGVGPLKMDEGGE